MHYQTFATTDTYPIALLIKKAAFNLDEIANAYLPPLEAQGLSRDQIVVGCLDYQENGKASDKHIKEMLSDYLPELACLGVTHIYCADAKYFKVLAGVAKAEPQLGYSLPCKIAGYQHMTVVLGVNYRSLMYNPVNEAKLTLSLDTLSGVILGSYRGLGHGIIKNAHYPESVIDIQAALEHMHQHPELAIDLETFSLDFDKAGIGTVTLCWNHHEGIAFACDYKEYGTGFIGPIPKGHHGYRKDNPEVRALLKAFLSDYKGTVRWHNASYDLGILIYELWMESLLDTAGLLRGLETTTASVHDTKIIAYLATNTTAGNELGLKTLAHSFAGNWAKEDIKDIRRIPKQELLEYNLIDGLSTNWAFDRYYPQMLADDQLGVYNNIMLPSVKTILQIELTGMPLNPAAVAEARSVLESVSKGYNEVFEQSKLIEQFNERLRRELRKVENLKLKTKQHHISRYRDPLDKKYTVFNPNSGPQLQKLLYEEMGLPIIDLTDTKLPATGGKTLAKLINHTSDPEHIAIMEALIGWSTAAKILSSFIPAFERAIEKGDGVVWLHGNFNIGGTVSGRLSSSNPNMQNIPSGSVYGKLIKSCFQAPKGWIFCGADFNSLEDYISALTTHDKNKLKVYLDGYDGHCLRAFTYFPDDLPGIVDTVESINSIESLFPKVRQKSKGPTFLLTYQGTYHGLHNNLGFPLDIAKQIETNYHQLYIESDEWVQAKLDEASLKGYVTLAFGLRLRTPLLARSVRGDSAPFEAKAEGRTAGNALGQSYGLLNNRAANAFMEAVWASPYRHDVKPVALIHDAIYLVIRDDVAVVEWVNRELIKAMQWQELPELVHDKVKLGAALDIFWPAWDNAIGLPNDATQKEIRTVCNAGKQKYAADKVA
jgi:DNA polymerase-1